MKIKRVFDFWMDAKHEALDASADYGFAYILAAPDGRFRVVACELVEEAPAVFLAEFKDGEEQ